jgi:hypothetical protein
MRSIGEKVGILTRKAVVWSTLVLAGMRTENNKASRAREWSRVLARPVGTKTLRESWASNF